MATSTAKNATGLIKETGPLGFPYKTPDPFLFCVYHKDDYPAGNDKMEAPRKGNGADFDWSQDYRMYHGDRIPGFPQHPHRGFETLTYVPEGICDHTDSLGNAGRYGQGDMQWMTAGKGCVHGENFPLVNTHKHNHLRLFQIWLNLPKKSKFADAGYVMHWAENVVYVEGTGGASCRVVAGKLGDVDSGCKPPKDSWGNDPNNDVAVYYITLPAGGSKFTLPPAVVNGGEGINRFAYIVEGSGVKIGGQMFKETGYASLDATQSAEIVNGNPSADAGVLVLQGRPINEPVAQRGPFVMNTQQEIQEAYRDYQRTQFGGWPWSEDAVVFPREKGRFALFTQADGKKIEELPPANKGKEEL